MKKSVILAFVMAVALGLAFSANAADWSVYESGRNNIRLDGYDGQPGYIEFQDGSGAILGYLFASDDGKLYFSTTTDITLTTTKLGTVVGEKKVADQ